MVDESNAKVDYNASNLGLDDYMLVTRWATDNAFSSYETDTLRFVLDRPPQIEPIDNELESDKVQIRIEENGVLANPLFMYRPAGTLDPEQDVLLSSVSGGLIVV